MGRMFSISEWRVLSNKCMDEEVASNSSSRENHSMTRDLHKVRSFSKRDKACTFFDAWIRLFRRWNTGSRHSWIGENEADVFNQLTEDAIQQVHDEEVDSDTSSRDRRDICVMCFRLWSETRHVSSSMPGFAHTRGMYRRMEPRTQTSDIPGTAFFDA